MEIPNEVVVKCVSEKLDINRLFEIRAGLEKNYPKVPYMHPNGDYGWDAVAKWSNIQQQLEFKRTNDIFRLALDILVQEKKLEILANDDRELVKEEDNS